MEGKSSYLYVGEGVFRGVILTVLFIVVYSIITNFVEVSPSIDSAFFLVLSLLSIVYGSIYSTRKIKRKGWIVGIFVALLYFIIIFLTSVIGGNAIAGNWKEVISKVSLAVVVGALSGMLGINL